ncbi:hypothetical protein SAMN05216323_10186 [Williamwhitmania taraxaci]|uniref:Uncharacterized protein n=1 Tax=Williamwhitmania taraxaci TaxID=1640674 RepID=A0A1G6J0H6_9BACT|nr:hypothetical protein SAMN05216323_10186 [Williamwhitmania taraxaci]
MYAIMETVVTCCPIIVFVTNVYWFIISPFYLRDKAAICNPKVFQVKKSSRSKQIVFSKKKDAEGSHF